MNTSKQWQNERLRLMVCSAFCTFMAGCAPTRTEHSLPASYAESTVGASPLCEASTDPKRYANVEISGRLLISDASPHGFYYSSRRCQFKLPILWSALISDKDITREILEMFYKPTRLFTEIGTRTLEANVRGHVIEHKFPEGTMPVFALKLDSISNLTIAPEGFCSINSSEWSDWQKDECVRSD